MRANRTTAEDGDFVKRAKTRRPSPTAEIQRALWRRARDGDPDAANDLAKSLIPWVQAKAHAYARRFRPDVESDELYLAAWNKFRAAVDSYDGSGTFSGYFFTIAAREMIRLCRVAVAREDRRVQIDALPDHDNLIVDATNPTDSQVTAIVSAAIDRLQPLQRDILRHREGYGTPKLSRMATAKLLKINVRVVESVHRSVRSQLYWELLKPYSELANADGE